jgi:hypothetical protein
MKPVFGSQKTWSSKQKQVVLPLCLRRWGMLLCWVFFLCFFFLFLIRVLEFEAGEGDKKERKMKERQCSQAWRTLKRKQWCKREREREIREGISERLWTRNARISWSEEIALNNDYVTWWGPYALGLIGHVS